MKKQEVIRANFKWSLIRYSRWKGQAQRDLIFHNGAVAVYRYRRAKLFWSSSTIKRLKDFGGDSGKLEKGRKCRPKSAALRELEEEIGIADLELLYDFLFCHWILQRADQTHLCN